MIEVELPDGTKLAFPEGTSRDEMRAAIQRRFGQAQTGNPANAQRNPDGTYGQPPEGMIANPNTGQMTSPELIGSQPATRGEAAQMGAMRGLSFGGSDEIMGGINAIIPGAGTMAERYAFGRDAVRGREEAARRDFPITAGGAEMAGGVGTALTYGLPALANRGLLGAATAGAGVGAAEGTVYGALSSEGGASERTRGALQGGILGGFAGGLAPVVMAGAQRAGRGLLDLAGGGIDTMIGRGSQTRANRALADTFDRSGVTMTQLDDSLAAASREGQPDFRLMDALGQSGQRRASGIVRAGGEGADEMAGFLTQRQIGQPERVASFTADAFDASRSAADTTATLTASRNAAANVAYDAARQNAAPVDVRGALDVIDARIGPMQGSGVAGDSIDGRLMAFRSRLAADPASLPPGTTARELSDFNRVLGVKQEVQDAAQAAYRAGRNNEGRQLDVLWRELDAALEQSSAPYRAANDQFRDASRVIDAVPVGQQAARPSMRATDNAATFGNMTPDQQAAARVGYGDSLLTRIESAAGPGTNRARPLTSPKIEQDVRTMALDPDLFMGRIGRENTMFETFNRALGGSRTADNLADITDLTANDMGAIVRALSGDVSGAAQQVMTRFGSAFTGMNEGTRKILADALMAPDTASLNRALAQAQSAQQRSQILSAMARIAEIQSGPDSGVLRVPQGLLAEQ